MLSTFLWILTLVVLLGLFVLYTRYHGRQLANASKLHEQERSQRTLEQKDHQRQMAAKQDRHAAERLKLKNSMTSAHQVELARLSTSHQSSVKRSEDTTDRLKRQLEDAREFYRKGMKWDLASRNSIIKICKELGIDGFLATNVVFDPSKISQSEYFAAQIDHVLVTDSFVLLIENKRWKGLVIADKRPSSLGQILRHLVADPTEDHFAIQVVPDFSSGSLLNVRLHTQNPPCSQVRKQAKQLSGLIKSRFDVSPWIRTCVFYSHSDFHFEGPRTCNGSATVATEIAAGTNELHQVIQKLQNSNLLRHDQRQTERLGSLLGELGADLVGFGKYDAHWGKPLLSTP